MSASQKQITSLLSQKREQHAFNEQVDTDESIAAYAFSTAHDEHIVAPELAADLRELPKTPKSLGSIGILDTVMPLHFLRKQLRYARIPTHTSYVDENALKHILMRIASQGFSLRTQRKREKYATYALRILTYLARNEAKDKTDLPFKEAIELLEAELKAELDSDILTERVSTALESESESISLFKHINYIMLALSYFIIQGQAVPNTEITNYFMRGIELLSMLSPAEYYYETLSVALTAKTKLPQAQPLSHEELAIIKSILCPVPVHRLTHDKVSQIKRPYGHKRIKFYRTEESELRYIKQLLRESKPLSREQLTYVLRRAKDSGYNHIKVKAAQIMRLAATKRINFPDKNFLIDVLNTQLSDDEFKIRANALITTKMLLEHRAFQMHRDTLNNIVTLGRSINVALYRRQEQALKALKNHLNMHFSQGLQDKESWISIIDNLLEGYAISESPEIIALAYSVRAQLVGDLCVDNIKHYIHQAQDGELLADTVIHQLEQALQCEPDSWNKDRLYKYWLILSYAADNGQVISVATITYAVNQYLITESSALQQVLLKLLGCSVHYHYDAIIIPAFLTKLYGTLNNTSLLKSACFFVDAWANVLKHGDNQKIFLVVLERLALHSANNIEDEALKLDIVLILSKAVKHGLLLSPMLSMALIDELEKATDKNMMLKLIRIMGSTLQTADYKIFFTDSLIEKLIQLSFSKKSKEASDALHLLFLYFPKAEQPLSSAMIEKIGSLIFVNKYQLVSKRIIDRLKSCHYIFSSVVEEQLSGKMPSQRDASIYQPGKTHGTQAQLVANKLAASSINQRDRGIVVKSLNELITETRALNQTGLAHNSKLSTLLASDNIALLINTAHEFYYGLSPAMLPSGFNYAPAIRNWPEKKIKAWARHFSSKYKLSDLADNDLCIEVLAVLIRTCELGYKKPRDVQLLALILALRGKEDKRPLLMQIATSEGKSLLTTMLSMIDGLFGDEVDNETSSEVLASRDAKTFPACYALWNITVASNEEDKPEPGIKACYKKSVVYSDSNHLQFDALRHNHKQLNTRGKRRFYRLNIDEVDSVTFIENTKFAMLGEKTSHMDALTFILACIWCKIRDLDNEWQQQKIKEHRDLFIVNSYQKIKNYTKELLHGEKAFIKIPEHMQSFVEPQIKSWIENAIEAYYHYQRDKHYTVETEEDGIIIAPTNLDTGVRQRGMSLNDGMQQFLQMKEGLPVESMTLMTMADTNRGYIERYDGNVVGISATLSGLAFRVLMQDTYHADIVNVPRFAHSQLTILPGEIKKNTDEWANAIIDKAMATAGAGSAKGRVVIVTCKTIERTQFLYDLLAARFNGRIIKYDDNRGGQEQFLEEEHDGNTIVVATTLAGRGMDLKLSAEGCRRGGVYQLSTFLADDPHTEEQIFGRAGRGGEPGDAQTIANWEDIKEEFDLDDTQYAEFSQNFDKLIQLRDARMERKLENVKNIEMPWIKNTNDIFNAYLQLKTKLDEIDKRDKAKHRFSSFYEETKIKIKREAVEERFGLWLQLCQSETKENALLMEEFDIFKQAIVTAYEKDIGSQAICHAAKADALIQNPAQYIKLGHALLAHADTLLQWSFASTHYERAITAYKAAGKIDALFAYQAYYHRALAIIQLGKVGYTSYAKSVYEQRRLDKPTKQLRKNYKKQAIAKLSKAKHMLTSILAQYKVEVLDSMKVNNPGLFKQFELDIKSKKLLLTSIDSIISNIERTRRRVSVELITKNDSLSVENVGKKAILERIEKSNIQDISLTFHDFKIYEDLTTNSQLENSIDKIPEHAVMKISFDSECFEDGIAVCRSLLPINRSYKHNKVDAKEKEQAEPSKEKVQPSNPEAPLEPRPGPQPGLSPEPQLELQPQPEPQPVAEFITAGEYWDYYMDKFLEGMVASAEWTAEKLDAARTKLYELKDWLKDNHLYEAIPVCLTMKKLTLTQFKSLLETLNKDYLGIATTQLSITISPVDPLLLIWLKQHQYVHKVTYEEIPLTFASGDETILKQQKNLSITFNDSEQLKTLISYLSSNENKAQAEQACIALDINKISQKHADKLMENVSTPIELHFLSEDKKYVKGLINIATVQQQQASLTVSHLNRSQAEQLFHHVDRTKQKLIADHKSITDILEKMGMSEEQLQDKKLAGYHTIYSIKEQNPMPWKSLALLSGLLVLETGTCAALFTLTAGVGTNFALAFAGEALGDLFCIAELLASREFDAGGFAFKKALGMTLNFSTAGLMPCAKAVQAAAPVKTVAKTLIRVSHTHAVTFNTKLLKMVGFHYAEKVIRSVAQQGVGLAGKGFVATIRPKVRKWLEAELKVLLSRSQMTKKLNRIFAYRDCLNRMGYYTSFYLQVHAMMAESRFKENGLAAASSDSREAFYQNFLAVIEQHEQKFVNFMTLLQNHLEFPESSAELACHWLVSCGLLESNNFELKWNVNFLKAQDNGIKATYDLDALQQLAYCPRKLEPYRDILLKIYVNYATCLRHDYAEERGELIDSTIDRMSTHLMRGVESTVAFGGWVVNQAIGCGLKFAKSAIKDVADVSLVEADDSESLYELSHLAVELAEGTFEFAYHEKFKQFMERNKAEYYRQQQQYVDKQNKLYHFLFRAMVSNIRNLVGLLIIHSHKKLFRDHQQTNGGINVLKITEKILEKSKVNKCYNYQNIVNALYENGLDDNDEYIKKLMLMLKQSTNELVNLQCEETKMFDDLIKEMVKNVDLGSIIQSVGNRNLSEPAKLMVNKDIPPEAYVSALGIGVFKDFFQLINNSVAYKRETMQSVFKFGAQAWGSMEKFQDRFFKVESDRIALVKFMSEKNSDIVKIMQDASNRFKEVIEKHERLRPNHELFERERADAEGRLNREVTLITSCFEGDEAKDRLKENFRVYEETKRSILHRQEGADRVWEEEYEREIQAIVEMKRIDAKSLELSEQAMVEIMKANAISPDYLNNCANVLTAIITQVAGVVMNFSKQSGKDIEMAKDFGLKMMEHFKPATAAPSNQGQISADSDVVSPNTILSTEPKMIGMSTSTADPKDGVVIDGSDMNKSDQPIPRPASPSSSGIFSHSADTVPVSSSSSSIPLVQPPTGP